ncbi:MAG: O-antigen ligase family protein [Candidatus Eremiobacteraeota bacterium]|nr:O-antigen ligase family protein [Candidatus Eremiobacteraeota bacterium]
MPQTPLDPLTFLFFSFIVVVVALLTMRRPSYGVAALVVAQPFALYRDLLGTTVTLPKVVLLAVLIGMTERLPSLRERLDQRARSFFLALFFVVAATAITLLQAQYKHPAIRETFKAVEYLLLFAAAYFNYRLDPNRSLITKSVVYVALAVSLLALSQEYFAAPSVLLINGHTIPRIAGPLEGPNQLAGYLGLTLPLLFALCVYERQRLANCALALAMFALFLTYSRAGVFPAFVSLAVVAANLPLRLMRAQLAALSVGLACGLGAVGVWSALTHSMAVFRFFTFAEVPNPGGVGSRSQLWPAAIMLWERHPFFGIGAGNFELEIGQVGPHGIRTHANSVYLQALVEGGLPLFAATLRLTWLSIAAFFRERARSPMFLAACAASIGLALHQLFDYLTFYPKVGGWWLLILALAAADGARLTDSGAKESTE